jgi:hypothetical protein
MMSDALASSPAARASRRPLDVRGDVAELVVRGLGLHDAMLVRVDALRSQT